MRLAEARIDLNQSLRCPLFRLPEYVLAMMVITCPRWLTRPCSSAEFFSRADHFGASRVDALSVVAAVF